jgi:hypothetical protein
MKLTPQDILGIDNKQKTETNDDEESQSESNLEGYNPNWTLRKCCSKTLDILSTIYPEQVFSHLKNYLESEMQDTSWLVK